MNLILTKRSKILFTVAILSLSTILGYLIWRVNQSDTVAPTDSCASAEGCGGNIPKDPQEQCGSAPTGFSFNKPPSEIGPFPEDGEVILYYKSLLSNQYRPKISLSYKGETEEFKMPTLDANKRAQVKTGIFVKKGESISIVKADDDNEHQILFCNQEEPQFECLGWIPVSENQCGSGIEGSLGKDVTTVFQKISVSSDITWAKSFGKEIVNNGSQCWADWREWPGDYDFNDFFLQVSYLPKSVTVQTEQTSPEWNISKEVSEKCINEGTENPTAELTYTILVENTGDGEGYVSKIEDTLDEKVTLEDVQSGITLPGVFTAGKIIWNYSTSPLKFDGGTFKEYMYKIVVEKEDFGIFDNRVTLTTSTGTTLSDTTSIDADCEILIAQEVEQETEEGEEIEIPIVTRTTSNTVTNQTVATVPQTGIFDSTEGKITVGVLMVLIGISVYIFPSRNGLYFGYGYRKRFEKIVK